MAAGAAAGYMMGAHATHGKKHKHKGIKFKRGKFGGKFKRAKFGRGKWKRGKWGK